MTQAAESTPNPWIVSARFDLFFFLLSPLVALGLVLPFRGNFTSLEIYLFVMTFSSFGHHLPGFLRAYGDAELFRQYKWRFLLAPPLLYSVFLWFALNEWRGMILLLVLWSIWHVMMQHFGFMRIYDAKVGVTKRSTALWDRAVTLSWFALIVLWSPQYLHNILNDFYGSGGPLLPPIVFDVATIGAMVVAGLVTLGYVGHHILAQSRGEPVSALKPLLLMFTLMFLGYVWIQLDDLVLGLAIWEIFHDLQYFAITWVYNRRLVEKGMGTTRLMNFLFRKGGMMLILYIIAIGLYGSVNWFAVEGSPYAATPPLLALIFTSTLLHYYFDGFIWKVRQGRTQAGLDLERSADSTGFLKPSVKSALIQVLGFAIPIGALAAMESSKPDVPDEVAKREAIQAAVPRAVESHLNLGLAYSEANRREEALAAYEAAVERAPDDARAHGGYATALLEARAEEGAEEAERHLLRAMELDPRETDFPANLAILYFSQNRTEEALKVFGERVRSSEDWEPKTITEILLVGLMEMQAGNAGSAIEHLGNVLQLDPENEDALEAIAFAARALGRFEVTEAAFAKLLELRPERNALRGAYVDVLIQRGKLGAVVPVLEELIAATPEDYDRKLQLAEILATASVAEIRDGTRATELAREVVEFTEEQNVGALDILGAALAESGDFGGALTYSEKALDLARERAMQPSVDAIQKRRELYLKGQAFHIGGATEENP